MEMRLNLDARKRVNLAKLLPNIDVHAVMAHTEGNTIVLELLSEIPTRELWLHKNPEALKAVQEGIQQSKEGKVRSRGSFAKHVKDEV
jgi:hypothetical protein